MTPHMALLSAGVVELVDTGELKTDPDDSRLLESQYKTGPRLKHRIIMYYFGLIWSSLDREWSPIGPRPAPGKCGRLSGKSNF